MTERLAVKRSRNCVRPPVVERSHGIVGGTVDLKGPFATPPVTGSETPRQAIGLMAIISGSESDFKLLGAGARAGGGSGLIYCLFSAIGYCLFSGGRRALRQQEGYFG